MKLSKLSAIAALVPLVLLWAMPASAQSVRLEFRNGRVTMIAQNASLRTILAEWARVGGTRIVNGERVTGAPVTLELTNVPERQALDIVLRNVSGYMAGPREVASLGTSMFDRIMIVPTSTPARATTPPAFQPQQPPQQQAFTPSFDPDDPEENPPNDIPPDEGQGRGRGIGPRGFQPRNGPNGVSAQPFPPQTQPDPDDELSPESPAVVPGNPFGVPAGSSRPGTITPVPQQQPPNGRPNGDPEP